MFRGRRVPCLAMFHTQEVAQLFAPTTPTQKVPSNVVMAPVVIRMLVSIGLYSLTTVAVQIKPALISFINSKT